MGNLTCANVRESAYDAFCETSPKILMTKRNTVIALRGAIHVACFIIHVCQGRLAMPHRRRGCHETRHFIFFQMRGGPHSDVKAHHFLFCAKWLGRG